MSIITIQVGQCGNQVGAELFSTIADDIKEDDKLCTKKQNEAYRQECVERFFASNANGDLKARSVLIDMEKKVISDAQKQAKLHYWSYPEGQVLSRKRGSGNNWASGYCEHGSETKVSIENLLQTESEKADRLGGFLVLLSLAGGTGSGLGTYVTELLRTHFNKSSIIAQTVWPYSSGEVSVQNYNAVLTLSRLCASADAVLCSQNDALQNICRRLLAVDKVSFKHLNSVLAKQMAGILQPAYNLMYSSNILDTVLECTVSHPGYRLLGARCVPLVADRSRDFSTFTWSGIMRSLRQMLIAAAPMEEGIDWNVHLATGSQFNKSVANLLVARGLESATADFSSFQDPRLYPSWMSPSFGFSAWSHSRAFLRHEKTAFLLSNCAAPVPDLDRLLSRAWRMFSQRAYVHLYNTRGVQIEHFLDSFSALEQILHNYKQLGS